jgi:cell division protein FtsQ
MGERAGKLSTLRFWRRSSVTLPLHERVPARLGLALAAGAFVGIGAFGAILGGHVEELRLTKGDPHHVVARAVGLGIDVVTISGLSELHEVEVLQAAGIDPRTSLAFFDAAEARAKLAAHPLISEAKVRKLYPGEVAIEIVEREAYALWQLNGEVSIIAQDGTVVDKMRDGRFAHLPLVVGPDANKRAKDYVALLNEAGELRSHIRGATLVSGRRWTLKLDNGLDVRLPEQDAEGAVRRLARFAREHRLIDKDIIAIDMRQADRVTLRLTEEAAAARAEMLKNRPKPKGGAA